MGQPFSTGAVFAFVRFGGVGSPLFLGTCEKMPQDSRNNEYEAVMNDISGTKIPLDFAWQGINAQISMVLTRWNEANAQAAEAPPGLTSTIGSWDYDTVGTLMGLEEWFTELWLVNTFGAALENHTAYTANGLLPGRHYVQTVLWSPQTDEIGTAPMKRHFMFYAWPQFNPDATPKPRFTLYDTNMTGISRSLIE